MGQKEQITRYNIPELRGALGQYDYHLMFAPAIPTTMTVIRNHALAGNRPPAVALTDHQTQGIGREGRVWLDKPGASILMSALLDLKDASAIANLSDLVALKAWLTVSDVTGIRDLRVKWPNDFVIMGKKTGGMLVQNILDDGLVMHGANVGIGINVHYSDDDLAAYPSDYGATALDLHTPDVNSRQEIVTGILKAIRYVAVDAELLDKNIGMRQDYDNAWRDISAVLNREVEVTRNDHPMLRGRVVDQQIGRGILVETTVQRPWLNHFDTPMKVRVLD